MPVARCQICFFRGLSASEVPCPKLWIHQVSRSFTTGRGYTGPGGVKPTAGLATATGSGPVGAEVKIEQQTSRRKSAHWQALYRYSPSSGRNVCICSSSHELLDMDQCFVVLPSSLVKAVTLMEAFSAVIQPLSSRALVSL